MRASKPRWTLAVAAFALALVGASCNRGDAGGEDAIGTITRVSGAVELTSNGATSDAVADGRLSRGDTLRVAEGGDVQFNLGGNATYRLVRGSATLQRPQQIRLADGVILVSSDERVQVNLEPVRLAFAGGSVRVDSGEAGRVAAYEVQDLRVTAGSQEVPVPQLWQVAVTEEGVLDQARPLQFTREDVLDAAHLQQAIEVDGKLGNLLRGLEPQLAAAPPTAVPERLQSAGIPLQAVASLASVPRSDLLMGLAFAREWNAGDLVRSFEQSMALKVLGASWGLVAQNFGVEADPLVASLQNEINAVLFPAGTAEPGQLVPSPTPTAQRPAASPATRPRPASPAAPAPAPAAPGRGPAPNPTATPGLVGPVVDPLRPLLPDELERIVDDLLGVVDGIVPIV
ncbi:MAG TPA: hypothetical protein VHJ78_00920 [Actinomycetota bacterium]|nr:hypothetical protein [Actinomycetota bacterium]